MKKKALEVGTILVLIALTGCTAFDEMKAQVEAEQKEEAQRKAERKAKIEAKIKEKRITAEKREGRIKTRLDGESAYAWYDRVEKFYRDEYGADKSKAYDRMRRHGTRSSNIVDAKKCYDEKMRLFSEMFVAELKREAHRKPGEDLAQWQKRCEKLLPTSSSAEPYIYEEQVSWRKREHLISEAKKVFDEEFSKGKTAERKQHAKKLILQAEKDLENPAFKYPYSNHIAGVELCDGYLSGLSYKWIATLRFLTYSKRIAKDKRVYDGDIAEDLANIKKETRGYCSYKDINFLFDKQYGTLHSVSFKIKGDQKSVAKKISEYKKKYPGLKHIRKTQRGGKSFNEHPIHYKMIVNIHTDTLESERMKIVIISTSLNKLEDFVITTNQLSDLQKKEVMEMQKKVVREGLEKNATVTITDKKLKKYFETLEDASATK